MAITRIESLTYGVVKLADCVRFVEDFGLDRVETRNDRVLFRTLANQAVNLVDASERDLPRGLEDGSTLREVIWGVDTQAALDALHDELARDRSVRVDADGVLHTHDMTGYAIGFALARPTLIVESRREHRIAHDDLQCWDRTFDAYTRARPLRLIRVTLDIPEEGRHDAVDFYRRRLRFSTAGYAKPVGTFLRCETGGERHGLLLSEHANRPGVNRIAFEVCDVGDMVAGGNFMTAQGWSGARQRDRGRFGARAFRMFDAPCGGGFEYETDHDVSGEGFDGRCRESPSRHDSVPVAS